MDEIRNGHTELRKSGLIYLAVAAVLAWMLFVLRDQLTLSFGSLALFLALFLELGMGIYNLLHSLDQEILDCDGLTIHKVSGDQKYPWTEVECFEVCWEYDRKNPKKDAGDPYILLQFAGMKKPLRLPYTEETDQCIRCNYGQPQRDDWTLK